MTIIEHAAGSRPSRRWALPDAYSVLAVAIAALVAMPVLAVVVAWIWPEGEVWRHLASTVLFDYIVNSLLLMVLVGAGVLVIGVGTAWLVTMCVFPGRRIAQWALLLPMAIPAYVIAYTYAGLLDFAGPVQSGLRALFGWGRRDYWFPEIRSLGGAATVMALVLYPYVYLLARAAFLEQSICVIEVSRTLGYSPWRGFRAVALPLARPAIVAGFSLALMETLNDFGTVQYFAVDTFTTGIFRTWNGLAAPRAAAQLASVLMLFVLFLIALERYSRGAASFHHTTGRYRPLPRYGLRGTKAALAAVFCAAPVVLGFLFPAAILFGWSLDTAKKVVDVRFIALAANSFLLAAVTALLAVVLALVLAYGMRRRPGGAAASATRLAGMGYGIPAAIVAVGVMLPLGAIDNAIDAWARSALGVSTGLLLSGTLLAVIYGYLVRFLAVSLGTVEAGLAKVTRGMDDAARTLGCGAIKTLWRVHVPLLAPTLLSAALLVFVDVMKELPATLIMRPFDFDTLAIRAYQLASDERLAEAAPAALAIVAVGILPVILLSRAIGVARPGSGAS